MGGTSLSLPSLPTPQAQQQTSALCQGQGLTQVLLLACPSSFGSWFHLKEGVGGGLGSGPGLHCSRSPAAPLCHLGTLIVTIFPCLLGEACGKEYLSDCEHSVCLEVPAILSWTR